MRNIILAALLVGFSAPAFAATYARVVNGQALDVVTGGTVDGALLGKFSPEFIKGQSPGWTQVPDQDQGGGLLVSGAKLAGGKYTNPAPPVVTALPRAMTKAEFQSLLTQHNGDLAATLAEWN